MVKTIIVGLLVASSLIFVFNLGRGYEAAEYAKNKQKAEAMCDRPKPKGGTPFVSEKYGAWHCFYRMPDYPNRINHSVLVI